MTPEPADLTQGSELLARSARALRESDDPGWGEASQRVLAAVRGATRRSWPVDASFPDAAGTRPPHDGGDEGHEEVDGRPGDRLRVSDQVVIAVLRQALEAVESCAPSRISLVLDDHECTGAEISLVAAYGTELHAAADRARALVLTALDDVLGPPAFSRRSAVVDVSVDDVTPGDPRR